MAFNYSKFDGIGEQATNILNAYAPGGQACHSTQADSKAPERPPLPNDQTDGELAPWIDMINKHRLKHPDSATDRLQDFATRVDAPLLEAFDRFMAEAARQLRLTPEAAQEWKDKGNKAFRERNYAAAVVVFTRALQQTEDADVMGVILNNRATALFNLGRKAEALLDAHLAVARKPQYRKAYYRRGSCLKELGYEELGQADLAASNAAEDAELLTADVVEGIEKAVRETREKLTPIPPGPAEVKVGKVRFSRDADYGRFMIATEQYSPGEEVVSEPPFAMALHTEHLLTHCEYCATHTPNIYPPHVLADGCSLPGVRSRGSYCSPECAANAWKAYGHAEVRCPLFALASPDLHVALRALLRFEGNFDAAELPVAKKKPEDWEPPFPWTSAAHISTLEGHTAETDWGLQAGGSETACCVLALQSGALAVVANPNLRPLDPSAQIPDTSVNEADLHRAGEALRRAMRAMVSSGAIVTKSLRAPKADGSAVDTVRVARVARALFQVTPLVNHSCDPNAFLHFTGAPEHSGRGVVLRAVRSIRKGEQISVGYVDRKAPTQLVSKNRIHSVPALRQALSEQYGFHCRCNACMEGLPGDVKVSEEQQKQMLEASEYFRKGRLMMRQGRPDAAVPALEASLQMLLTRVFIGEHRQTFVVARTHDALAQCYSTLGDWDRAREHCGRALRVVEAECGEGDLQSADHRLKLSNILIRCKHFEEAAKEITASEAVYARYYGPTLAAGLQGVKQTRELLRAARSQ
eukprot:Hpha_TRINITY_DN18697_c0_g1::TRINITY_DN18697_c0_g1_i1::g.115689::m.115689